MDNKYLPESRYARDSILEKMSERGSESFWCSSCNCSRPILLRVMKMVNGRNGKKVPHARCIVCVGISG